jgi:uncharacterized protein (DUF927 family)
MDEKELLSKKTFIDLLSKNDFDRIEREDELFIEAKKLGLEKKFKESLKKYEMIFKDKMKIGSNVNLPECKYNISNYNFGLYDISVNGITDKANYKFSYIPVIPVERYINQDTQKEKIKLIYYKGNKWNELVVDRSQIAINQKLLLLSDNGIDVNSENVRYYINYFNDIINTNNIKKLDSVSHLGWCGDNFIPYECNGIFDGTDDFSNIYKAVDTKGNYDIWLSTIKKCRAKKEIRLLMAMTLASPLIEKLSIQPYIVNFWSSLSGNGKTLSSMLAMSIWGNPDTGALRFSSNSTQNYYITVASFLRNITCYFDELQIVKNNKYFDLNSLVMDLCNGTEKGRLNKNSQAKEVKIWNCNFLFTNNNKMVKENAGEQVYNRVIDIEVNQNLFENPHEVADIIKNNYGFFGKEYIKLIKKIGFEKINEEYKTIYNNIIANTKATDKQASSLASIMLADKLVVDSIFTEEKPFEIDDIKDLVNDRDEIKTSMKAKEYIINIINANSKRFDDVGYGEIWGIKDDYNCTINSEILSRELKKGGFEFDTIKKDWAEDGFLEKNSMGRFIHQTTVRKEKGNYIRLKIS